MRIAQRLYEGVDIGGETVGLITYMRTDGVEITPEALPDIRNTIASEFGKEYLPGAPRTYQNKSKNAQEAHEAIRPTDVSRRPRELAKRLDADQAKLYELIWVRTIASQMESADIERTTVDITAKSGARVIELRATGQVTRFDGFLKVYQEGKDDDAEDDESRKLPAMSEGEKLARARDRCVPAFYRATAALLGSLARQAHGRTRHRSPVDVCVDLAGAQGPHVRAAGKETALSRGQGPRRRGVPREFFRTLRRIRFHCGSGRPTRQGVEQRTPVARLCCATSGPISSQRSTSIKDVRIGQVLDVLDEMLAPHIYTPREDGF